jgi:UDP-2-acetamido-2-deoxy-ribo-hexuluronate aminotransferase
MFSLSQQYIAHQSEIDEAIGSVLLSGQFIQGPIVSDLEERLADYVGVRHCVTCNSGTDALLLSLLALNVCANEEVITTPFSFFATAEVISLAAARPVFVDIEEDTYNIDVGKIEEKITEKTKAIMPVGIFGQPPDMKEIKAMANKYELYVIEDAAQSFGAIYRGSKSCSLGDVGCTSFYPTKPLGCYGDGGALFTNNDSLSERARLLVNHGQSGRYNHVAIGFNSRLDAVQAAVLRVRLGYLDKELEGRRCIAEYYMRHLKDINDLRVPRVKPDRTSVFAQYSLRAKRRDELLEHLKRSGVPAAVHYPVPIYRHVAYAHLRSSSEDFPVCEAVCREIISLPVLPFLTQEAKRYVVSSIREFYKRG